MDIRRFFTSPKSSAPTAKTERTDTKQASKQPSKLSKKRRIDSDSDEGDLSPKKRKQSSVKKDKTSIGNGGTDTGTSHTSKNRKGKRVIESSSDEEFIPNSYEDKTSVRKTSAAKKAKVEKVMPKTSPLKAKSVSDFFGSAPVQRHTKKTSPKKPSKTNIEDNHDDEDFRKTLMQLAEPPSPEKGDNNVGAKMREKFKEMSFKPEEIRTKEKEGKTEKTVPKTCEAEKTTKGNVKEKTTSKTSEKEKSKTPKKSLKRLSSDLELIPPTPPAVNKKEEKDKKVTEETPEQKRRENYMKYMSYQQRDGPRALGSKEIPEGADGCLTGLTFVITGVLESIERDDAKSLIEKYGGKVMSTLTKNTKCVVIGRDAGTSKLEKAEKFGTKQLDEDGLFELIRNSKGQQPKEEKVKKETATPKIDSQASQAISKRFQQFAFKDPKVESAAVKAEVSHVEATPTLQVTVEVKKISQAAVEAKPTSQATVKAKKISPATVEAKPTSQAPKEQAKGDNGVHKSPVKAPGLEMWVDKYKPTSLKQIIGQQGDKSNAKKLFHWLVNYRKTTKNKKPATAGPWNTQGDGAGFKAALLSGPPGVGKTTTAQLVCKEAKFDFIELNASDTRSKKMLQSIISELLLNQSLAGCFKGGSSAISSNHVIIMDEVDGMAGNEDRGGIQELIGFIKVSKVPIICICNDRNHPKIRSLSNYCFDLRFQRPRVEQIKAAMMSVSFKEGLKVTPNVLQDIIVASNHDIRQVLHNLSLWCANEKGLSQEQAKKDIGFGTKHIKMGPFDVLREVFAIGHNSKATINDKAALFFHDYSIAPLFVQENYVHVMPRDAGGSQIKHLQLLSEAANNICIGDLIDKQIRSNSSWSLLPTQAIFSSVLPGELLMGHLKQMISFPSWLGKNSSRNHMDRILQELQMHMRMRITGNKTEVGMDYLPLLRDTLTRPLIEKEADGVKDVLEVMDHYNLLREDFDSIVELSLWPQQTDPRTKITTKVKSAFTRAYNKECGHTPYAITAPKKKRASAKDDELLLGEDEDGGNISEEEEEDDDNVEKDAMIKVKKPTKKTAAPSESEPSTSKKPSSKGRRPKKS